MASAIQVTDLTPGLPYTLTVWVWVGPFLTVKLTAAGSESDVLEGGDWRQVTISFQTSTTEAEVTLVKQSGEGTAYMDVLTPVAGEYTGQPFDGNTPAAYGVNYEFEGLNNASASLAQETPVTLTLLDTTPTINGLNTYRVTTNSDDGATTATVEEMTTNETTWAFINTGAGFADIINFAGNLKFTATPRRETALVQAAGRRSPIALFGAQESLTVNGSATILRDDGSTPDEIETLIQSAGKVCYRDPSGRRMFGTLEGNVNRPSSLEAQLSYTITEAS